jgi:hypothetical protein
LKACQKDESFRDGNVLPNVLTMPEPIADSDRHQLFHDFFKGEETNNILAELDDAFDLLKDAQTLGSIMKFNLSKSTLLAIRQTLVYWKEQSVVPDSVTKLLPSFRLILALTQKYTALVMNPPYMGSGKFNNVLSKYVKDNYSKGKADLFAVFMLVAKDRLVPNGKYAMINMQSWMFLSSFEQLRKDLLETMQIDSMLHLGSRTFDELSGEVVQNTAFVVSNINDAHELVCSGVYYRLVDGKNCADKERMFLENRDGNVDGAKVYYPNVKQKDFEKIPGCPIGYWVSNNIINAFSKTEISLICETRCGLATGNNSHYVRVWFEVNFNEISFNNSRKSALISRKRWFPYNSAGGFRKWYGLTYDVIDWFNDGHEMQTTLDPTGKRIWAHNFNLDKIFQPHLGWSDISSQGNSFRYYPKGFLFTSNAAFLNNKGYYSLLMAYANSKVVQSLIGLLNPTLHFTPGNLESMPFNLSLFNSILDKVEGLTNNNISLSKLDWDAHETSWDFAENPLVAIIKQAEGEEPVVSKEETGSFAAENYCEQGEAGNDKATVMPLPGGGNDVTKPWYDDYHTAVTELEDMLHPADCITTHGSTLELCVNAFEKLWTARFMQLHANEEELNRQFIDIYGLQDELIPDVPLSEITILQQGEISIE